MGAAPQLVDNKLLRGLVPLDGLSPHNFSEVVARLRIEQIEKNKYLFKEGQHDINAVYLIEGKVEIQHEGKKINVIRAGSHDAAYPLAPSQPRQQSALAKTRVTIATIDRTLLEVYSGSQSDNAYEVHDINSHDADDDWMTRLLQSETFLKLPPMNIQRMLTRMESVQLNTNDIVIKQGDEGDAYYTIKYGKCRVTRRNEDGEEIVLAELGDGACFGEDALLSENTRSATITMTTPGELMRLAKKDFLELLNDPLSNHVSFSEATDLINQGAKWLDTRSTAEHGVQHIRDSLHIPLPELRDRLNELEQATTYITYCNNGHNSAAASFVLGENGIDSRALSNGISTVDTSLIHTCNKADKTDTVEDTHLSLEPETTPEDNRASAEIIGFEESYNAKHLDEIKKLRDELNNLRKLSETRLTHSKLKAHEQIEKLQNELKHSQATKNNDHAQNLVEIERLTKALAEEQENAARLSTSKLETENTLTNLVEQVRALSEENDKLEESKQTLNNQAETLQSQLDEALANQSNSDSEQQHKISVLQAQLAENTEKFADIENQLQQAQKEFETANNEADKAKAELAVHQEEIARTNAQLDEVSTAQRRAEQEITMLRGKLDGNTQANEEVIAKFKQQLEQASNEHQHTRDEREELKTQLSIVEQQLSEKQSVVSQLSEELSSKQTTIDNLNTEKNDFLAQQNATQDELESLKSKLTESNNKFEDRIKDLSSHLEDSHRQSRTLEQDNHELKLKLEEAARENERIKVSLEGEIDAEVSRLLDEVKSKSSELTSLQSELNQSSHLREQLQTKIDELESSLKDNQETKQHELGELHSALSSAEEKVEQLEKQLTQKEDDLVSSNSQIAELKSEIASQENTEASLQKHTDELNKTQQQLEDKISTYEIEITALKAGVENHQDLSQQYDSLSEEHSRLQKEMAQLQQNLESAQSNIDSAGTETQELRSQLSELEKDKQSLQENLDSALADQEDVAMMRSQIEELESAKQSLQNKLDNLHIDEAELQKKRKQFEQEKSILLDKLSSTEENIESLNNQLEESENKNASLVGELEESQSKAQKEIETITRQYKEAEVKHAAQLQHAHAKLEEQISDQQQASATLEDIHANYRAERLDLESQLHEQSLLREQAAAEVNSAKLEMEGLRAELKSMQQQLTESAGSKSGAENAEQLQRLSSDLAKAVEYRKQSEITKQTLQDEIGESKKEIARLKGENDGHLELRIQLEGQLAVLRQRISADPAANQIFEGIDDVSDSTTLGSVAIGTDIGQTSWESKPRKSYNKFMIAAFVIALLCIGISTWFFKEQLGLEDEWRYIEQQFNPQPEVKPAANTNTQKAAEKEAPKAKTKQTSAAASAKAAKPSAPTVKPSAPKATAKKQAEALIAVTPTSREVTPVPFRVYRNALKDGGASPEMVEMPSGSFTMGSGSTSDYFEERPQRDVSIKRFAMSKHEVSFADYDKFVEATNREFPDDEGWGRDNQPVINVSWQDAVNYTTWLSEQTGHTYRLPSEAEWEYVARAGTQATYWWGNEPRGDYVNCHNCKGKLAGKQPLSVENYEANPFGIKNSAGNVSEWVQDCYHSSYENAPTDGKAWVTDGQCNKRMTRGGSFRSNFNQLRSSARDSFDINTRSETIGFRVVREY